MMPKQGGYYIWVRDALGPFWGFQEGWWTLCYSAVDLAIYPVLFVTYLSYFYPSLVPTEASTFYWRWGIGIVFVLAAFLLNLRGSYTLGWHLLLQMSMVLLPFMGLVIWGWHRGDVSLPWQAWHEVTHGAGVSPALLASGLAIVMWNYTGWDNVSTYAEEIERPAWTIPRSLFVALGLIMVSYLVPMWIGYQASTDGKVWTDSSGWPEIAARLLSPGWGTAIALMAVVSAWALFNSQLLYLARLPQAMARDGILPPILARVQGAQNVPVWSLAGAAFLAAVFCGMSLGKLMIVDILLYSAGLALEFFALLRLRHRQPQLARPFRIPLPLWALVPMSLLPLATAGVVAVTSMMGEGGSYLQIGIVLIAIALGVVIERFWIAPKRLLVSRQQS